MKRLLIGMLLLLLAAQFGCSKAGIKEQVVFEVGKDHIFLVHETDKEGKVVSKKFDHPADFTQEEITGLLAACKYSEYSFFKWRGNKPVFIEDEQKKLAKHVSQALAAANSDSWVKFAVTAKKRDLLLPTRRITDGYIFVQDGKFNIVLANLNFELSDADDPYSGDPRDRYSLGMLKLNEGEGMSQPSVDPADPFLKRPHNNWIVLDPAVILASRAEGTVVDEVDKEPEPGAAPAKLEPKPEPTPVPEPEKTLEQRLLELRDLFDKGLISEEDYERKKEELLKEL